jgi:hypothetical protein
MEGKGGSAWRWGDWTPLELFITGLRGSEAGLRRLVDLGYFQQGLANVAAPGATVALSKRLPARERTPNRDTDNMAYDDLNRQ